MFCDGTGQNTKLGILYSEQWVIQKSSYCSIHTSVLDYNIDYNREIKVY